METLEQQFKKVRKEINTSHVMQFGDLVSELGNTSRFKRVGKFHQTLLTKWGSVKVFLVNILKLPFGES